MRGFAAAVVVGLLALAGCSDPAPPRGEEALPASVTSFATPSPRVSLPTLPVQPDVAPQLQDLLDVRAAAVRDGDRDAFLATVGRGADGVQAAQAGYFDNLAQLPLEAFHYELRRETMVRDEGGYWAVVEVTTQLGGFDALPVMVPHHYRFQRDGETDDGAWAVASVRDPDWEAEHEVRLEPWDLVPITVRRAAGILAVFDEGSIHHAKDLMRALRQGVGEVSARVPYDWPATVIVYAPSDASYLDSFDNFPGGDPEHLDGVAFGVLGTGGEEGAVASTRIALSPDIFQHSEQARERLIRHELTHAALAGHDTGAPVWLAEGLAEWVAVQALAPDDRQLSQEGLAGVREAFAAGSIRMPRNRSFNGDDAAEHYALAWWVMEYLARTWGEKAPFLLLDQFEEQPEESPTHLIRRLLSMSVDGLARRGAKLLLSTYEPTDEPTPTVAAPTDLPGGVTSGTSAPPSPGSAPTD